MRRALNRTVSIQSKDYSSLQRQRPTARLIDFSLFGARPSFFSRFLKSSAGNQAGRPFLDRATQRGRRDGDEYESSRGKKRKSSSSYWVINLRLSISSIQNTPRRSSSQDLVHLYPCVDAAQFVPMATTAVSGIFIFQRRHIEQLKEPLFIWRPHWSHHYPRLTGTQSQLLGAVGSFRNNR